MCLTSVSPSQLGRPTNCYGFIHCEVFIWEVKQSGFYMFILYTLKDSVAQDQVSCFAVFTVTYLVLEVCDEFHDTFLFALRVVEERLSARISISCCHSADRICVAPFLNHFCLLPARHVSPYHCWLQLLR